MLSICRLTQLVVVALLIVHYNLLSSLCPYLSSNRKKKLLNHIPSLIIKQKIAQRYIFLKEVLTQANKNFGRHNNMSYAAAIAYHAMISLPSLLLVIILAIGGVLDSEYVVQVIMRSLTRLFSREVALAVEDVILTNIVWSNDHLIAAILAGSLVIYSASNMFREMVTAMNNVWDVPHQTLSFFDNVVKWLIVRGRKYIIGLFFALGIIFTTWGVVIFFMLSGYLLELLPDETNLPLFELIFNIVNFIAVPAILTFFCAIAFKALPERELTWRQILPGAILTGVSLSIMETFIGLYVGRSRFPTFYGVAGSTIILLLWIYFSSVVLLFGAEVTRAYIEHES